ncbi:Rv1733c family protein [Amycolatopsis sp. NBC_00438]|uniref:Rv1733c family protein n=1 Tax=Amycolatopsis sp. NBC_00438 TaxID=2903558 RepID=UPI002E224191
MDTSSNRIARMWHTVLPRRGSVARPSDRVQGALLAVAVMLALAVLPFAASFGSETYVRQQQQSAEQLRTRTQVVATLLADGPALKANTRSGVAGSGEPADATWTLADGTSRAGKVVADQGAVKGDRLPVWVDGNGNPSRPPLTGAAVVIEAVVSALGLWLGAAGLLALACYLTARTLDRFRLARWQQEWFQEQDRKTHS